MGSKRIQLFSFLCLGFILFTVIGTLSHEWGHYIMARLCGHGAEIHYQYCVSHFRAHYSDTHGLLFSLGGPLQTITTGTVGVLLVYFNRSKYHQSLELNAKQWFFIFISLFWLREPFNLFTATIAPFLRNSLSQRGDEISIAYKFGWPPMSIILTLGVTGAMILAWITFKIIPKKQRMIFLAAGLIGGFSGFFIWLQWLGPIVMP